jgi:hypothetical protein
MCSLQQRIHEIDVENKVLTENGRYDDYAVLLMEANEQVSQEKQGILAKIFEWFAKVFDSIHKSIAGIFAKKVDPNTQVNAPAALFDNKFNQMLDGVMNILNNDIVKMFASAAIGALAKTFGDKLAGKVDELVNWFTNTLKSGGMKLVASVVANTVTTKLQNVSSTLMDFINKLKNKKPETDNDATAEQGMLKKLGSLLTGVVNKGIGAITTAFSQATGNNQQANTNNQQAAPAQNTQQAQPAPAPAPAANANQAPQQQAAPVTASTETEKINDGELSLYESVFGKLEEEKKEDDISDLLDMI